MADPKQLRSLAFVLPQYHPIPENDEWWGPGFTEWTNVVKARPLFRGHQQPHLPRDLGFYDLRLADTRAAQAELAGQYGVNGFVYYHYWFDGGRRLLERPMDEILSSGEPDFPFCLCWANENWTRIWNGGAKDVLLEQSYSPEDDLRHIRWLAGAFSDPRYIKVDGRPLFMVYRQGRLPDAKRTTDVWREEAQRLGIGEIYLCAVESFVVEAREPAALGFDAAVQFAPDFNELPRMHFSVPGRAYRKYIRPTSSYRMNRVYDYPTMVRNVLGAAPPPYKRYPCVTPGFDNTARRPNGGARAIINSSPAAYESWLREVVDRFEPFSPEENFVFTNAWNEWAEGNHLEPDQRWGRAYLEAHRRALQGTTTHTPEKARSALSQA